MRTVMTAEEADALMQKQIEEQAQQEVDPVLIPEIEEELQEMTDDTFSEEEVVYDGSTGEVKNYQETWTTELITVGLSEKELAELAVSISTANDELKEKVLEFTRVKKSHTASIKQVEAEIQAMILQVEEGYDKEIRCIKKCDFDQNKVIFHDGKGEIYFERVMQENDKQLKLDGHISKDSLVNESDSITLSENIDFSEDEEMEQVTENMLTDNSPVQF